MSELLVGFRVEKKGLGYRDVIFCTWGGECVTVMESFAGHTHVYDTHFKVSYGPEKP